MSYNIICEPHTYTLEIKRSQFIAHACVAFDRGQALDALNKQKFLYPDARHHCWAYLIGNPKQATAMAMSDDGEPSGTAGKPILNVLQHNNIGDLVLIVSRYFGGIKLGAAGLVRAYSGATQQVLNRVVTQQQILKTEFFITCAFAQEQYLRHALDSLAGEILESNYSNYVHLRIQLPKIQETSFRALCATHQYKIEKNF